MLQESMDGILFVDKPTSMTSHDVVDRVRKLTSERRVGHSGTLDPFATGLLILGIGKATKTLNQFVGLDKTYEATLMLGATSDTFDREGKIETRDGRRVTKDEIEQALEQFRGGYEQKAPIFSAKKLQGKKLYELARSGKATEEMRPVKLVKISELRIMNYEYPLLELLVSCSSGTYIRSLADDIGQTLGVGAYLTELRRTKVGDFNVSQGQILEDLNKNGVKLTPITG